MSMLSDGLTGEGEKDERGPVSRRKIPRNETAERAPRCASFSGFQGLVRGGETAGARPVGGFRRRVPATCPCAERIELPAPSGASRGPGKAGTPLERQPSWRSGGTGNRFWRSPSLDPGAVRRFERPFPLQAPERMPVAESSRQPPRACRVRPGGVERLPLRQPKPPRGTEPHFAFLLVWAVSSVRRQER